MTTHDETTTTNSDSQTNQETELDQCQTELAAWKDKYVHLAADFQNFKKRLEKDRINWELGTQKILFLPLLTILDDFDRALAQEKKVQQEGEELDPWLIGFTMIAKEFYKVLGGFGVKPMEQNTTFDPEYHEAISQVASDKHESGEIVDVLQKGFILNDTVLRPAKVAVAE